MNDSYQERKSLDKHQLQKYIKEHIIGLQEDVFPCEIIQEGINCVAHITTIQKNILNNLSAIFNITNSCIFINSSDKIISTSLYNLQRNKSIHSLLSKVDWYILETETSQEAKIFLDEIGANSILIPYKGEEYDFEYDYKNEFMSIIIASAIEKVKLSSSFRPKIF